MIRFKDFVPAYDSRNWLGQFKNLQNFEDLMPEVNEWIEREDRRLINIETVVLPNIHNLGEEGSVDTDLPTAGKTGSRWHQFIRVWYQEGRA